MPESAGSNSESADRIPIIVGITGKRQFDQDPAENTRLSGEFEGRFRSLVTYLDAELPSTPKVLLCGGAAGVDLITARIVLEGGDSPAHPAWTVVIVLAFQREVFLQDFATDPDAFRLFEKIEKHPRTIVKTMPSLLGGPEHAKGARGEEPVRVASTDLGTGASDHTLRGQHFEQFGLWLARSSMILVAGMAMEETGAMGDDALGRKKTEGKSVPPEGAVDIATADDDDKKPARLGGTARVVAFRRTGVPDSAAAEVIQRSSEIAQDAPVEEPDGGYVLLIDPRQPDVAFDAAPPVQVLRPVQQSFNLRAPRYRYDAPRRDIYRDPGKDDFDKDWRDTAGNRMRAALTLSRQFEAFHRRQGIDASAPGWLRELALAIFPSRFFRHAPTTAVRGSEEEPVAFLVRLREGALTKQQSSAHILYRHTLQRMISIFLVAVIIYEIYIELFHEQIYHHLLLLLYISLLGLGAGLAVIVRTMRIQSIDEDYRGLKEMLRVQIVWWQAQITWPRVDRVHLRTIDSDLRLVREALATIVLWAQLRCTTLHTPSITEVPPPLKADKVRLWIELQVGYFSKASGRQKLYKQLADRSFTVSLLGSLGALALLGAMLVGSPEESLHALRPARWVPLAFLISVWLLAELCSWVATGRLRIGMAFQLVANGLDRLQAAKRPKRQAAALKACVTATAMATGFIAIAALPHVTRTVVLAAQIGAVVLLVSIAIGILILIEPLVDIVAAESFPKTYTKEARGLILFNGFWGWVRRCYTRLRGSPRILTWLLTAAASIAVAGVILSFCAFECSLLSTILAEAGEDNDVFRDLVLIVSVLFLAGAGMARFYTDKRNHAAQAAHYDDMHRAFRRVEGHLERYADIRDAKARHIIVEIGKRALEEGEAWMKAHRERPAEPIAGG